MCGGECVCWLSRTQKCVTRSTSEAEYVALEDNQGAVQLSKNPVSKSNSKHIDVRHHFPRKLIRQGDISMNRVPPACGHLDESISIPCVCDPPTSLNESERLINK